MAYSKQTWATGDTITAQKLNHMEDGIAAGGGFLLVTDTNGTLDKTWKEIDDSITAGVPVFVKYTVSGELTANVLVPAITSDDVNSMYGVVSTLALTGSYATYTAQTKNDYPTLYAPGE